MPPAAGSPLKPAGGAAGSIALDQWRGLALLLVLAAHAFHQTGRMDGVGRVGVNLFFFISGILVFRSLDRSENPRPWALARSFWRRRLRRLYPALLAYVLVISIAEYWLIWLPEKIQPNVFHFDYGYYLRNVPAALFYLVNYVPLIPPPLGHLWSVSCEMQFYLLAPLIFLAGGAGSGRRYLVFGTILLILFGTGIAQPFLPGAWTSSKYHFQAAVWPMMLGFCCEYKQAWIHRLSANWLVVIHRALLAACFTGLAVLVFAGKMKAATVAIGGVLLVPCLLAYACGWPLAAVAGGAVLSWLGKRTFSIYLWQQPFTICYFFPVKWWPLTVLLAVPVGALWFHYFEAPFLSSGRKKMPPPA